MDTHESARNGDGREVWKIGGGPPQGCMHKDESRGPCCSSKTVSLWLEGLELPISEGSVSHTPSCVGL